LIILDHPASIQETKHRASELRIQLEDQLPQQKIEVIQHRAEEKTFISIAEELLRQT
jgi:hypothetical protein